MAELCIYCNKTRAAHYTDKHKCHPGLRTRYQGPTRVEPLECLECSSLKVRVEALESEVSSLRSMNRLY